MRFSCVHLVACLVLAVALGCQHSSSDEWPCAEGASSAPQEETQTATERTATVAVADGAGGAASAARDARIARVDRVVEFGRAFGEAVEAGRKQTKPMMLFFGAKWCRFCKAMEEESFRDPAVVELSRQFVCVAVDVDVEPGVCHDFGVNTLPTVLFTSSSGIPMNRQVGETSPSELLTQMEAALRADTARHQIEGTPVVR